MEVNGGGLKCPQDRRNVVILDGVGGAGQHFPQLNLGAAVKDKGEAALNAVEGALDELEHVDGGGDVVPDRRGLAAQAADEVEVEGSPTAMPDAVLGEVGADREQQAIIEHDTG